MPKPLTTPARRAPTTTDPQVQPRVAETPTPPPVATPRGGMLGATLPPKPATEIAAKPVATRIKVRATMTGYYDHIRRTFGDVFYIADERAFSTKWMERVSERTPERVTSAPDNLRRQHDELLRERMPGGIMPLVDDEPDADTNPLGA